MGLEDYKPELSEEELDLLDGLIEDCGGDEDWSETWDGYDVYLRRNYTELWHLASAGCFFHIQSVNEAVGELATEGFVDSFPAIGVRQSGVK